MIVAAVFSIAALERLQRAEKFGTIQCPLGKHVNNILNFTGDNISACKVGIIKDRTEDTFCQQMLDEHLLYGSNREVRINRGLTLLMKTG